MRERLDARFQPRASGRLLIRVCLIVSTVMGVGCSPDRVTTSLPAAQPSGVSLEKYRLELQKQLELTESMIAHDSLLADAKLRASALDSLTAGRLAALRSHRSDLTARKRALGNEAHSRQVSSVADASLSLASEPVASAGTIDTKNTYSKVHLPESRYDTKHAIWVHTKLSFNDFPAWITHKVTGSTSTRYGTFPIDFEERSWFPLFTYLSNVPLTEMRCMEFDGTVSSQTQHTAGWEVKYLGFVARRHRSVANGMCAPARIACGPRDPTRPEDPAMQGVPKFGVSTSSTGNDPCLLEVQISRGGASLPEGGGGVTLCYTVITEHYWYHLGSGTIEYRYSTSQKVCNNVM
jgi:hypothetical protein